MPAHALRLGIMPGRTGKRLRDPHTLFFTSRTFGGQDWESHSLRMTPASRRESGAIILKKFADANLVNGWVLSWLPVTCV
jgi:hypothetical protein